jgi:HEAT repeat protein
MDSLLLNFSRQLNNAFLVALVLASLAAAVALLLIFLAARRAWQHFRIQKIDALSLKIHQHWRDMVRGEIRAEEWRGNSLQCDILQSIVIQEISAETDKDRAGLQDFLRRSGLVDRCIERVYNGHGWSRRRAMLALGAMRVPEAIPPLAELLDHWQLDTRLAAVQALGRTGLPEAAEPILETLMVAGLKVPSDPVSNALTRCFMDEPAALLPFLRRSRGESRALIARIASELATPKTADEMVLLAEDPNPEVRASAAKALAVAHLPVAISALSVLIRDEVWFVRLRSVSALNEIPHPRTIPLLLEAIRDSNRLVRMRAAAALSKFEYETKEILQSIVDSRDRYALHAMISALELAGGFKKVMDQLTDPALHDEAAARLVEALREGSASLWSTRPADPVVESVFP